MQASQLFDIVDGDEAQELRRSYVKTREKRFKPKRNRHQSRPDKGEQAIALLESLGRQAISDLAKNRG